MLITVLIVATIVLLCIHRLLVVAKKFEGLNEHMERYNALMDELGELEEREEEEGQL